MQRRNLIKGMATGLAALSFKKNYAASFLAMVEEGNYSFVADWASLAAYEVPKWFRDAKFGIWAHWGPQCQPEHGDWYARGMYQEGTDHYKYHLEKYGHPSKFGFKDVINEWKAEHWDPDYLVNLYRQAGAKYFVAMASHHDNFDNFNSSHQPWNSVNMGPKKDLIAGWANAAKKQGLHFGVSIHAAHAWSWMEPAQRSDKKGPLAGVPYDGKISKEDGKGKWWDGYNPQDLYAQDHPLSENSENDGTIHKQWNWGNGVTPPSKAYCEKFHDRTIELINTYKPDLLYFDDTGLPLWPVNDAGLRIAAHMYNNSIKRNGKLEAVINGKILDEQQRRCMVWDIERGASNQIEPFVWQTDTCIGDWHYNRRVYDRKGYKSAKTVIQILVDVVSKNGNLLLNVPVRGDGTIDEQELAVVQGVGKWMQVNGEAIYATRPWRIFGEGPAMASAEPLKGQGFNEGKGKPLGAEDFRFTQKEKILYAVFFGWPSSGEVIIKALAKKQSEQRNISKVHLLGTAASTKWKQTEEGLVVSLPAQPDFDHAFVLKIS